MRTIHLDLSPVAAAFYNYHSKQSRNKRINELLKKALLLCIDYGDGEKPGPTPNVNAIIPERSKRGVVYNNTGKLHVKKEKQQWLSSYFEEMFYYELRQHVQLELARSKQSRVDLTVQSFMQQYGISEDEMKLESVIKRLRRDNVRRYVQKE